VKAKLGAHHTDHWDVATYDAVMVLADALKRSGSAKPDDITKALLATDYQRDIAHLPVASLPYGRRTSWNSRAPWSPGPPSFCWTSRPRA